MHISGYVELLLYLCKKSSLTTVLFLFNFHLSTCNYGTFILVALLFFFFLFTNLSTVKVYNVRGLTQPQKLAQEVRVVPHLYILM